MTDNILELIYHRARDCPHSPALHLVETAAGRIRTLARCDLLRIAWNGYCAYRAQGLKPGDRIAIMLPVGEAYLGSLLGALWGGFLPTTLFPVDDSTESKPVAEEIRDLVDAFAPALVVGEFQRDVPAPVLHPRELIRHDPCCAEAPPSFDSQKLAYVQFTSGSTGRPKGLALTWSAIMHNVAAITDTLLPLSASDHIVSWLPMYHDMGLFGALLVPIYAASEVTLMDTSLFRANPLLWLHVIEQQHGTVTVTPPSALHVTLELLSRRRNSHFDLRSLRQIICGSEPITAHIVAATSAGLVPLGVPPTALQPVYGLAEATLAVTATQAFCHVPIESVDANALATVGQARPQDSREMCHRYVSVGTPLSGITLQIVDKNNDVLADRNVGRILVQSPSLMAGTIDRGMFTPRDEEWLDTGDLGFRADGELYITGRHKETIIKSGRNYAPERIEILTQGIDGVRRAAAFGVYNKQRNSEQIVLLIEPKTRYLANSQARDKLRLNIRSQLQAAGVDLDIVKFVERGSIPVTTSGKVRRHQCRLMAQDMGIR